MGISQVCGKGAVARRLVLCTAAAGVAAMGLAAPAAAEKFDQRIAVDCPKPYSQNCPPRKGIEVPTWGPLFVTFTADPGPRQCAPIRARIFIDGKEWGSNVVWPGQNDGGYFIQASPGKHLIEVQADGVLGGCNTGSMSGWAGTLHVENNEDALNGATP
ncbi:hypothetical protein C731_0603 [Mycolicibacterium hassiacum DSM 44199]|uniref:Uncharacterized protein n=1 Tax=Mycolicibacterium hassiacum (strain DSM 44199 / CIP 105218 / JCM 12690 / 3849) TaxID=1122247 RepID=K5BHY2_MYCHD|nr:hypothetical protein [Mycolicibacterium hassiacum]EKF25366.1 hypothetical protein C731_0603 [Mycolicibacterium hassiacum DSM 44199]MDA4085620.1 hypothetical protein [Mycolicibacterium hassiacum DSM 44199]VCT93017.1 hypothetical protein MHAS_04755 [Mycolicibacterium hassiacum DSM 44199]